mgnify:FL=1
MFSLTKKYFFSNYAFKRMFSNHKEILPMVILIDNNEKKLYSENNLRLFNDLENWVIEKQLTYKREWDLKTLGDN